MDTKEKIARRLEKLRECVGILETLKGITGEELERDIDKRLKAERCLEVAIEACIDIAQMIIVGQKLPTPETAADAIKTLGDKGIIPSDFAAEFAKAAGLRNILIHEYTKINYVKIADKINNKLSDFNTFAQSVAGYIGS